MFGGATGFSHEDCGGLSASMCGCRSVETRKLMENTGRHDFATADLCSQELSSLVCVIVD
jgi:hypothetical protein